MKETEMEALLNEAFHGKPPKCGSCGQTIVGAAMVENINGDYFVFCQRCAIARNPRDKDVLTQVTKIAINKARHQLPS